MLKSDEINKNNNKINHINESNVNLDANNTSHDKQISIPVISEDTEIMRHKNESIRMNYVDVEILTECICKIQTAPNDFKNEIQNKDLIYADYKNFNINSMDNNTTNTSSPNLESNKCISNNNSQISIDNINNTNNASLSILSSSNDLTINNLTNEVASSINKAKKDLCNHATKIESSDMEQLIDLADNTHSIVWSFNDLNNISFSDIFSKNLSLERYSGADANYINSINNKNFFEPGPFNTSNDCNSNNETFQDENSHSQYYNHEDDDYNFIGEEEISGINHDNLSNNNDYFYSDFESVENPVLSSENSMNIFKKSICNYTNEYANKYSKIINQLKSIDFNEEYWARMDGVSLRNDILEYSNIHHSNRDVGFAQAKLPFSTQYNYFELEILDIGTQGAIAIGATNKGYPKEQHPGWCKNSIAYHADDGKIFVGKGIGDPFGPTCQKGDKMGCGILFPQNYDTIFMEVKGPNNENEIKYLNNNEKNEKTRWAILNKIMFDSDDDDYNNDDEIVPNENQLNIEKTAVEVYFTKNGEMVGSRWIYIPRNGFFPTIGLLSENEKVRFFQRPMTG